MYEAGVIPSWVRTGLWQLDVAPIFASAEVASGEEFVLVAWEGGQISLTKNASGGAIKVSAGTLVALRNIEWAAGARFTLSVDMQARTLTVGGALSGNGQLALGSIAILVGRLSLGGLLDGTKSAFARLSELRKVVSISVSCKLDSDCVRCGDGDR